MPRYRTRPFQLGPYWLSQRDASPAWYRTWFDRAAGRTRRQSLGTDDLREAERRLTAWFLAHHARRKAPPETEPLAAVFARYWEGHAKSIPSAEQARIALAHLVRFCGEQDVAAFTLALQDAYVAHRRQAGVSEATIGRELSVARAALTRALKRHELVSAPYVMSLAPGHQPPKGPVLSLAELATVFDAIPDRRTWMFALTACNTLARADAVLDLTLFQCDLDRRLVHLNPPGRRQTKKRRPTVPMTRTLEGWLRLAPGPLVIDYHGRKIARPVSMMRRLARLSGVPISAYSFRHSMARELAAAGVPRDELARLLGHGKSATTDRYAPYEPDYLKAAAEAIDDLMARLDGLMTRQLFAADAAAQRANCAPIETLRRSR